jgi:transposase
MDRIVESPGALDVHKASVMACVRVWVEGVLEEHVAEFKTTALGLLALRDWLEALGVHAGRDGDHQRVLEALLGGAGGSLRADARQREGGETGPWAQDRCKGRAVAVSAVGSGAVEASFVPSKPIRTLRNLTPYRKTQINDRSREADCCTRSWRTPGSSSTASRPTSSVAPVGRCSTRSSRVRLIRSCSPSLPRESCA